MWWEGWWWRWPYRRRACKDVSLRRTRRVVSNLQELCSAISQHWRHSCRRVPDQWRHKCHRVVVWEERGIRWVWRWRGEHLKFHKSIRKNFKISMDLNWEMVYFVSMNASIWCYQFNSRYGTDSNRELRMASRQFCLWKPNFLTGYLLKWVEHRNATSVLDSASYTERFSLIFCFPDTAKRYILCGIVQN